MRARGGAIVGVVVLAFYLLLAVQRGVWLIGRGQPLLVLFGVAVLVLPVIGAWFVWREVRFGFAAQKLARQLAAEGGLPMDDLPRRPSGRVDRDAADAVFAQRRAEVEQDPADWRRWYRLAVAYGDARDSTRGRRAMRQAIALHDQARDRSAT